MLLLDEVNGIAMEELAACLTELNLAIAGSDENQVAMDHKQDTKEETYAEEIREETPKESRGDARRVPMPLKRRNAGMRADQTAEMVLAGVRTPKSMFQHRYGLGHAKLIQKVFRDHEGLACSHDQPDTM